MAGTGTPAGCFYQFQFLDCMTITLFNQQYAVRLSSYWHPTPKRIRQIADAWAAFCTTVTGWAVLDGHKWVSFSFLLAGAVGKFISDLLKADDNDATNTSL
jgi:hypothetical protein